MAGFAGFLMTLAVALAPVPAAASQALHSRTESGYFIYREDRSCALYADYGSGTMLRLSYRTDENAVYLLAVNEGWGELAAHETVTAEAAFPDLRKGHGFGAAVIELDGRSGVSGALDPEFLEEFAASRVLTLSIVTAEGSRQLESFAPEGAEEAVRLLRACTQRHFAGAALAIG